MMELSGVLMVLLLLSRIARSWIATGSAGLDLWKKVDDFFANTLKWRAASATPARSFGRPSATPKPSDGEGLFPEGMVDNFQAGPSA
jgi:hypothetical protein